MSLIFNTLKKMSDTSEPEDGINSFKKRNKIKKRSLSLTGLIVLLLITIFSVYFIFFILPDLKHNSAAKKAYIPVTKHKANEPHEKEIDEKNVVKKNFPDEKIPAAPENQNEIQAPPSREYKPADRQKGIADTNSPVFLNPENQTNNEENANSEDENEKKFTAGETGKHYNSVERLSKKNSLADIRYDEQSSSANRIIISEKKISSNTKSINLANKINAGIKKGDTKKTDYLIKKLKKINSKNSGFAKRVTAYRYIKAKQYEKAIKILNNIVTKNPDDTESQINYFIALFNSNKKKEAYIHLKKLKQEHPENDIVVNLFNQIKNNIDNDSRAENY